MLDKLIAWMSLPIFVAICSLGSIVTIFAGDEGMWTFDNLPLAQLEEQYHLHQQTNG